MNRRTSIIVLSLYSLLERFSYYGVRAIIVLYAVSESGLNLSKEDALSFYGTLTFLVIVLPILFGIVTDKFLGQKKAIYIGGLISLTGYILLIQGQFYFIIAGLFLIAIGVSLVKPSSAILLGRLFYKNDKNRDFAFLILLFCVNIGAFFGVLLIGYLGETVGWQEGFILAAFCCFSYTVLYHFTYKKMLTIETNDIEYNSENIKLKQSFRILFFLLIVNLFFWHIYGQTTDGILNYLQEDIDSQLFGFSFNHRLNYSLISYATFFFMIVMFLFWYKRGLGSTIKKFGFSFIFLSISISIVPLTQFIDDSLKLEFSLFPILLLGVAEVLMSSFIISYLTRVSDVRYSTTIYSVFFFLAYCISNGLERLNFDFNALVYFWIGILALGVIVLVLRKRLESLVYGLD